MLPKPERWGKKQNMHVLFTVGWFEKRQARSWAACAAFRLAGDWTGLEAKNLCIAAVLDRVLHVCHSALKLLHQKLRAVEERNAQVPARTACRHSRVLEDLVVAHDPSMPRMIQARHQ